MRNRLIRVLLFTLALSLLAVSYCAFAYADGEVRAVAPASGTGGPEASHGFDVIGSFGGSDVASTVGSAGFRTWLRIGADTPMLLGSNGSLFFGQNYGDDRVRVTLTSSPGFDGKAVIITYTVQNISSAEESSEGADQGLVIRVGSCGSTTVGGDTDAAIVPRGGGFVSESGGLSLLVFPTSYSFSGSFFGAACAGEANLFSRDQDCDMSWYWYIYLQPGQTAVRSVAIAVGNQQRRCVYLDPNGGVNRNSTVGVRQERLAIAGTAFPLPPTPFERGGYRFLGWAVNEEAEAPNYLDESLIPADQIYEGLILYAVWQDKSLQTIEASDLSIPYGDPGAVLPARSSDGKLSFAVKTGADVISIDAKTGAITTKQTGTATVTITAAATNEYNETKKDVTVTVTPKQLEKTMLTLTPETLPFSGDTVRPTISVRHGDKAMIRGTDYEIDASSVLTASALGEYRITINGLGNYSGSTSAVWKIAKTVPTAQVSAYSGTYDGAAHPLLKVNAHTGGTLEFSLNQAGPWSTAVPAAADAGSYTVWYRIVGDAFWLDASPVSCTAEIARKAVSVSGITVSDKVYDASTSAQPVFDRAQIAGVCSGDDVKLHSADGQFADADAGQDKRVRISAITLGGSDAHNYILGAQQQTETTASISPRPITIRARDQAIPLYGSITQGTEQVTVSGAGLCRYDTLRSVWLSMPSSLGEDGTGSITPSQAVIVRSGSTQDTTKNYTITYEPGKLTAERREVKLSWSNTEFVYDGKSHVPTARVSGTQYGEVLSVQVSGAKVAANPEGEEYVAKAVGLSGTNALFYKLPEAAEQSFVITPRSLEQDAITVEYKPDDEISVIGPVPNDGKAYGFKSIVVYDGTRRLTKDVDYTLDSHFSTIYGPHTLHITGKGNYEGRLSRDWTMIGDGLVSAGVDVKNGAALVYWNNASEDLAERLLDDGDRLVREEYGTPTDVLLSIRPAVTPSGISAKAGQIGETVAVNYDLSLYKRIGNDMELIRDTDGISISVTLDIPQELRKAPLGYYRSFSLIHLHDGTAEVLAQGTGRSFTFTTTRFSSYAISYRDIQLPPTASPPTGDTAQLPLWSALLLFSACGLLCLIRKKRGA
ncbi:MAG: YDG domain-containing protein [Eubacteriales bacterium]|nr:YDG domain-containing protein [Eubacteriales bacterium]